MTYLAKAPKRIAIVMEFDDKVVTLTAKNLREIGVLLQPIEDEPQFDPFDKDFIVRSPVLRTDLTFTAEMLPDADGVMHTVTYNQPWPWTDQPKEGT